MGNQSLDGSEILNIRWAHPDSNPVAQAAAQRANEDAALALLQANGIINNPHGEEPVAKRPYQAPLSIEDAAADAAERASAAAYFNAAYSAATAAVAGAAAQDSNSVGVTPMPADRVATIAQEAAAAATATTAPVQVTQTEDEKKAQAAAHHLDSILDRIGH